MAKYSYEQKLKAVLDVIENYMSCSSVAKSMGTAKEHVRRWVRRYEEYGEEGLLTKSKKYSGEFKASVVEFMYANHLPTTETAVIFKIPGDSTVGQWKRIYDEEGREALFRDNRGRKKMTSSDNSDKEKSDKSELDEVTKAKSDKPRKTSVTKNLVVNTDEDLIAEVNRLRMENAYLKKLQALVHQRVQRGNRKR